MAATDVHPEQHLARFRLSSFRPGQREVIEAVLAGRDCLCIMPTGGGKSLCYQLPSVAREGMTLVVSPLIALMKDQVDGLTALGIAATFINSSLPPSEALERMNRMAAGAFDLVYIAPERLRSSLFLEKLRETKVQLLAVDEAHCISEWGHDFRPDYARLGKLRERLGYPQTIALTATATPDVQQDIVAQLRLREPQVFITGFARDNLHFEVQSVYSDVDRDEVLLEFLEATPGAGIIYSATRKRCVELVELLSREIERPVAMYHAGLEPPQRRRVQDEFMSGKRPIVVATNAFGMGIDKPDLRFVVHYNIPGTLEAYYQEAGRAGRDGQSSRCLLIYSQRDRRIQEFFIESAYPEPDIVQEVYDFLRGIPNDPIELTLEEIRERLNLPVRNEGVSACEKLLENCGALERLDARQNMAAVRIDSDLPTLVDLLPKDAKVQRKVLRAVEQAVGGLRFERVYVNPRQLAQAAELDPASLTRALRELTRLDVFDYVPPFRGRAVHMLIRDKPFEKLGIDFAEQQRRKAEQYRKLDRMIAYATTRRCRQLAILEYFGDKNGKKCDLCDNCGGLPQSLLAAAPQQHDPRVVEAVRIVLSGVARMRGRFGKQLLAKMLTGSKAKELTKFKLNQLSTFGLLSHLKEPDALGLIDALLQARLLQQVEETPYRPLIQLTPRGEAVMKGKAELVEPLELEPLLKARLKMPRPGAEEAPAAPAASTVAQPVAAQPPVAARPAERVSHDIDSVNALLAADDDELANEPASAIARNNGDAPRRGPHYWTWRVFQAGFTAEECLQIRGLETSAAADHLLQAAREGLSVDPAWMLSPEQQAALQRLIGDGSPERLQSQLGRLPPGLTYRDVQLYLLTRETNRGCR